MNFGNSFKTWIKFDWQNLESVNWQAASKKAEPNFLCAILYEDKYVVN